MAEWSEPEDMRRASVGMAIDLLSGVRNLRCDKWSVPSNIWVSETVAGQRLNLSDLELLAMAVLRDSEGDKALMAAFLDELMGSGVAEDEPVTESWCRTHGLEFGRVGTVENPKSFWWSPTHQERDLCVWIEGDEFGIYHDGTISTGSEATVSQVVRLCLALGIPWSASDSLGK